MTQDNAKATIVLKGRITDLVEWAELEHNTIKIELDNPVGRDAAIDIPLEFGRNLCLGDKATIIMNFEGVPVAVDSEGTFEEVLEEAGRDE